MAVTYPTGDYRIHQNSSEYLWTERYTGTTVSDRTIILDVGIKNYSVANGTVDVYWELGTKPKTGSTYSSWYALSGLGYSVGDDKLTYSSNNIATAYAICSLDYTGNFKRTDTSSGGTRYTVYRVAQSGMFTLKCDSGGKFSFSIYGAIKLYDRSVMEIALQTVTLPETYDVPQAYAYTGVEWKSGTPYAYDGTQWLSGLAKAYDGTSWEPN